MRPLLGIVDPLNTDSCPREVHISSGLDVLFHALEVRSSSYFLRASAHLASRSPGPRSRTTSAPRGPRTRCTDPPTRAGTRVSIRCRSPWPYADSVAEQSRTSSPSGPSARRSSTFPASLAMEETSRPSRPCCNFLSLFTQRQIADSLRPLQPRLHLRWYRYARAPSAQRGPG